MKTRSFDLGDILSVVLGQNVCRKPGVSRVYDLVAFMVNGPMDRRLLDRALPLCRAEIIKQHPTLGTVTLPIKREDKGALHSWMMAQVAMFADELPLKQMEPGVWNLEAEIAKTGGAPRTLPTQRLPKKNS